MMPFHIQQWSWIFIFQSLLVQLSVAHRSHDIIARETIDNLFSRGLSKAEKTRNAYIAVAITASLVLVVGLVGLFLFIRKRRHVVDELEAGASHKASWMFDGKKVATPTELPGPDGRTRTQRLKAALRLRVPDQPVPPPPQLPTIAIHSTSQHPEPNVSVPPRALLGSSSERRTLPRSPAASRRRSRSLAQPTINPFLPLGEPNGPVSQIATLKARPNDSDNSRSPNTDIIPQPSLQVIEPATPNAGHRHRPSPLQLREPTTPRSDHRILSPVLQLKGPATPRSAHRILSPVFQLKGPATPRSGRKIQFKLPGSSRLALFPAH